jgi:peptidoglycan/xylan/chitin deacetylase (PgdA/CDA1 family)
MALRNRPHLSCCLTFDFDGMASWIVSMGSNNPSEVSRGEYGAVVGMPRILDLLKESGIRATFCVPGRVATTYPALVERAFAEGHEIAHHGWIHEDPAQYDVDGEKKNLELGIAAIERVTGLRPIGYRSPSWGMSQATIGLLVEYGFLYDSSCMGGDFFPYYLRSGDGWSVDGDYSFGDITQLVEMPVYWGLDDAVIFEFVMGQLQGLAAPSAVEEIWRGDFDYAHANCPGGVYNLTLHPHVIARGHRMLMLERLIEHFRNSDSVTFGTLGAYASGWKAENPLERWKQNNPLRSPHARPTDGPQQAGEKAT